MPEFSIFAFTSESAMLTKCDEWGFGHYTTVDETTDWVWTLPSHCAFIETVAYSAVATFDEDGDLVTPAVELDGKYRILAWRTSDVVWPEGCDEYLEGRWNTGETPVKPDGCVLLSPITMESGL